MHVVHMQRTVVSVVMVQIRHVPEDVHRVLRARAAAHGQSLSDFLRVELTRIAARPTLDELAARIESRGIDVTPTTGVVVEVVQQARAERDDALTDRITTR